MAPKKKASGKKKKKPGKGPTAFVSIFNRDIHEEESKAALLRQQSDFLVLDLKLLDWKFANLKMPVRSNTLLSTVVQRLREKHGPVSDFKLFKNPPTAQANEVKNFDQPVSALGFTGGSLEDMNAGRHEHTLFYDFKVTHGYENTLDFLRHGDVTEHAPT